MKLRYAVAAFTVILHVGWGELAFADRQTLTPDASISASGTSGGQSNSGDCGFVAEVPNHTVDVAEDLAYVLVQVQASGSPTLLIEGPTGRYCVLPEGAGGNLQFSGYAPEGTYNIYIGDREQGQHAYNLSILGKAD